VTSTAQDNQTISTLKVSILRYFEMFMSSLQYHLAHVYQFWFLFFHFPHLDGCIEETHNNRDIWGSLDRLYNMAVVKVPMDWSLFCTLYTAHSWNESTIYTIRKKGYGYKWARDTIQLYTWTQIKVKEQRFYCCSTFHSHCRAFNNDHNSYPKMIVKWILAWSWAVLFASAN
jgi:hypothetical protein